MRGVLGGVSLVLVAGGRGARLGGGVPKAFLPLVGEPILVRSLRVFSGMEFISQRVLVVPEEYRKWVVDEAGGEPLLREVDRVVAGGERRQDSVANGIAEVEEGCELVMIHDAVRPFVRAEEVVRCAEAAGEFGAAVVGVRASDTLKECDEGGRVVRTVSREGLWAVQTPQAFRRGLIVEAYRRFGQVEVTDDSELVEMMGEQVVVVEGRRDNIKVTRQEDLYLAESLLRGEREGRKPKV